MSVKKQQAPADGLILVDKPAGFTSFDVVAKMRGMLKTRKVGHAGTLDPMATGLLPIFVGRGTKCCDLLPNQDKRYVATFRLGTVTDTLDSTGTVLEQHPVHASAADVRAVLKQFTGSIMQVPPMYSAIQVGGKRLYDLARQGIEVERKSRPVTIYSLAFLEENPAEGIYVIDVSCSKGTYIRTLCSDIGAALGCGAVMTALRRTQAAGFSVENALTLEQAQQLAQTGTLVQHILPVEQVFAALPVLGLTKRQSFLYCNGVPLALANLPVSADWQGDVRVADQEGRFLGVSTIDWENGCLKLRQLFFVGQTSQG